MDMEHESPREELYSEDGLGRRRRSFLFPLLLIVVGVVLLLRTTGVLSGEGWATLIQLWPLLLVAIGLDSLLKGEGAAGAVFWIGLGAVLLLANLNMLALNTWSVLLNLWPLLLIAIGLDLVVGRRSRLGSLVSLALLLLLLAGAVLFMSGGPAGGLPDSVFTEPMPAGLRGNTGAAGEISLKPVAGVVHIRAADNTSDFVQGSVSTGRGGQVQRNFELRGSTASLTLEGEGIPAFPGARPNRLNWDLAFTGELPLEIQVDMAMGELNVDFRDLNIRRLEANLALGRIDLSIPEPGAPLFILVSGGMGETVIAVPPGAAVKVQFDAALAWADMPDGYQQDGGQYTSPTYHSGGGEGNLIEIKVSQAIGRLRVTESKQ